MMEWPKLCRECVGLECELTREIRTKGVGVFPEGTRVVICGTYRGRFHVYEGARRSGIRHLHRDDLRPVRRVQEGA